MEEQIRKYKEYKFHEDDNFKKLLQEIASQHQNILQEKHLELFRRKWYQEQIDPTFNINFDGNFLDFLDQQKQNQPAPQQDQPHIHNCKKYSKLFWLMFYIEGYLKFCFLTSVFASQFITIYLGFFICGLALIRQLKMPQLTNDYFGRLLSNEFFHNILYLGLFYFFKNSRGIVIFFPMMIHCWIGLCECIYYIQGNFYSSAKRFVDLTRNNRDKLMRQKNYLEVLMFFWLFFRIIRGQGNIFLLIFYFNYLRVKYCFNDRLKEILDSWAAKVDQVIESPKNPRLVKYVLKKIKAFLVYLVSINSMKINKPSQTNQEQNIK